MRLTLSHIASWLDPTPTLHVVIRPCAPPSTSSEKFVTRKEYDEIKDSLTRLESILTTPGASAPVAADEVKAAVDIVKSKAGLISKVISGGSSTLSSVPPQARGKSQPQGTVPRNGGPFDDDNTQGRDFRTGLSSANDSDPNSALSSGGPFSYQPFPLNVPSHSPIGGPDYMAGPYNHSPLGTSHFGSGAPNQSVSPGYFPPTPGPYQHQQRPPEIHLGGLVVEDQSPQSAYLRGANSLSTLASVANSSSRADMGHLGNSLHQRSLSGRMEDVPHSHTSSLTLAPIPAHPTNSSVSGDLSRAPSRASLIPASLPLESNAAKRDELRRILRDVLPTKEICDRLMGHYFEKVEWSLNLLHRATFLRAYEAFWFLPEKRRIPQDFNYTPGMGSDWDNGPNGSLASHSQSGFGDSYGRGSMGGSDSGDKGSKSDSASENNLSSAWISLLFALLCVAMERLGFYDSKALGIVEEVDDYKRLCKSLFEASQTIMVLGNFLNSKSIETVQTLILHLHCQQSVAETNWETHTAVTIAAAARIGNMMGLNKLTQEKPGPSRAPGFLKRELGRRAWWSLIEKDWSLSTRTGYTYAINPNQNFCDVPANLDWGEPEAVLNSSIPRSREIWTHASLFLAKADIAKANRELLDRYNSLEGVSYAFLMNHHAQLEQSLSRIPSALIHLDGDLEHINIQVQWDRLLYTFHSHYSIILTHRPYIVTALLDAKNHENEEKTGHNRSSSVYTNSLEASLRSAETILDTIEEAKALDYPGVQWWQTTLYCYVAAVVLLAERWYTSEAKPGSLKSEDAEERKRKIVAAIALLQDQGESIDLFSEAATALDSLLDATTSARRKARRSSSKRGMDITDVVNPINIPSRPGSNASTPSFVREWIERPNTPLSPPRLLPEHERSLSTISLTPGVALTADNSFDSHFWARVFDLQFGSPVAITDPFFPSAAKETNQNDAMEGVMGTAGGSMGMKNTAPLWNALSGQIGNMNPNERSW